MSGLTPERWKQVKELLEAALAHEPGRRKAFLAEACAGDSSLQREVETLISSHEQAGSLLEVPAIEIPIDSAAEDEADSMIGQQIGPYALLREIGRGGMGAVYLADRADGQYQKKVAIKLIKRGMDTDAILRRFRKERQILAGLDHPNIARLLDGGTTEKGLSYFVMEYIEGKPLHEYCDAQKLPTTERLKLFRTLCSAVHYAHQNLVVHRDLKPSNILVTAEGTPKLLDFGIAKLLSPDSSSETLRMTVTGWPIMTPEYASPEQILGEPVTVASDVYSLGVLLYELLTGHRPYRMRSRLLPEVTRVICEEEPEKPSTVVWRVEVIHNGEGTGPSKLTPESVSQMRDGDPARLRRRLAGDIDTVVLKAMSKEPQRRYASAEELSEDIRRHLEGLPVLARKGRLAYRAGKFVRRRKAGVLGSGLALLAIVGGLLAIARERRLPTGPSRHWSGIETVFQTQVSYRVGRRPFWAAVGDFNADGRLDLAVANWVSNDVSILLGREKGSFEPASSFRAGKAPISVVIGDFDRDRRQDLAVADYEEHTVSLLRGRGDGTFREAVSFPTRSSPRSIVAADFDRDGLQDLAVANLSSHTVSVLRGRGDGTFDKAVDYGAGHGPSCVAEGDFDHDGWEDLVVANSISSNISVLRGKGDGTFQKPRNYDAESGSHFVAVGDFNGDGRQDLAVANLWASTVSLLRGRGDGTFEEAVSFAVGGGGAHALAANDFNGDERLDLAVTRIYSSSKISILQGRGDGSFQTPVALDVGTGPAHAAVGDFNLDGRPDLAVANSGWPGASDTISILINSTGIKR